MTAPPARLEGVDLRVERGGAPILRGVSVAVHEGELLAVVGPSGAGKSTLFGALVGELPLASGQVRLEREDVTRLPLWARARRGVGYIPQGPSVLAALTVRANLGTFHRIVHGRAAGGDAVVRAAENVGLGHRLDVLAKDLSAGERRRLEFARAITRTPRVLLCDEPFAGVDPLGAKHLGELLAGLARTGVAVILADHHVDEALAVCTRALLLLDGAVAVVAPPGPFRDDPLVRSRYLGDALRTAPEASRPRAPNEPD